jgi:hypothetical protein
MAGVFQLLRDILIQCWNCMEYGKSQTLKGLTPYEYIEQQWQQPERCLFDPFSLTLGLYTQFSNLIFQANIIDELFTLAALKTKNNWVKFIIYKHIS